MRILILIGILVLIVLRCSSQTPSITDTVRCVPVRALQNAMQAKDSLTVMMRENADLKRYKDSADSFIKKQTVLVNKMDSIDARAALQQKTSDRIINNQDRQLLLFKANNEDLQKALKNTGTTLKIGVAIVIALEIIKTVVK